MKYLFYLLFSSVFFISCGAGKKENTEQASQIDSSEIFGTAAHYKKYRDSLIAREQGKAIEGISFGMGEKEVNDGIKAFNTKYKYQLGDYKYLMVLPQFTNNRLLSIYLKGEVNTWDDYDEKCPKQLNDIFLVIKDKYGKPDHENNIPVIEELKVNHVIYKWTIGDKVIRVFIESEEHGFSVDAAFYSDSMYNNLVNANTVDASSAL